MKSQAICGWILCLALLKLYVNVQVTRLLNKILDGVWCLHPSYATFLDVSQLKLLLLVDISLKGKTRRCWPLCDSFKCNVQQLAVIFS